MNDFFLKLSVNTFMLSQSDIHVEQRKYDPRFSKEPHGASIWRPRAKATAKHV